MSAGPESRTQSAAQGRLVLLTGATGYVGSRLLRRLCENPSLRIRCLARQPDALRRQLSARATASVPKADAPEALGPEALAPEALGPEVLSPEVLSPEVVAGDVLDRASLRSALDGVDTAYYLVHLMGASADFEQQDRLAAENFAAAAVTAGVRRIIYLGGLGEEGDPKLSPHLRSRQEVGRIFRESGVETIEFRASVVVGAGSISFELIRSLTDRLPVMLCPRWLATATQPIAVDDILAYLLAALELPPGSSRVLEIGGADVVTYGDLIREYARQKGLRRWLIRVPVLTPYLSSLWLGLVTPASAEVGRHLIEGLRNPTLVRDKTALELFPIRPLSIREAVRRALEDESKEAGDRGQG